MLSHQTVGQMATLDTIISAAAQVFRTKGYHAATVQDIADEVGILKGSLYHHCAGKDDRSLHEDSVDRDRLCARRSRHSADV